MIERMSKYLIASVSTLAVFVSAVAAEKLT